MKYFISATALFLISLSQCFGSVKDYSFNNDTVTTNKIIINDVKPDSLKLSVDFLKTHFKTVSSTDSKITHPLNYILNYLGNDTIKNIYLYLKNFNQTDSLYYYSNYLKKSITDNDSTKKTRIIKSINYITNYISNDSVTRWLSELKRDSIKICFKNIKNDTVNIWLKNNRSKYSRFWLKNMMNDSVGIWLNNLNKNTFRILLDDDIFTKSIRRKIQKNILKSQAINFNSFKLKKRKIPQIAPNLWEIYGTTSMNVSQGYLSNWAEGGASSISLLSTFNLHADYSKKDTKWDNIVDLKYGILKNGGETLRKNDDKIELSSKFGQKAFNNWYYSVFCNIKTQFSKGFDYPNDSVEVSNFMSPAYLVFAFGLDYKRKSNFSMLISPITSKFVTILDTVRIDQTKYGLNSNETVKKELGAYFKIQYKLKITNDINIDNKLNLFSNYRNNPQNIDVNYEMNILMRINEFINTTIHSNLIYDDNVEIPVYKKINGVNTKVGTTKKIQFKELLSIGIAYKF